MKVLPNSELEILSTALHYLHMTELKDLCKKLKLPTFGKKGEIIRRICRYLKDGTILQKPIIPEISKAKNLKSKLTPSSLILKGSYKNDDATRKFMKTLVGNHFHFTAFGQEWIQNRWMRGNPPNYSEFAAFWKLEYEERKKRKASPKQEWAYLNFIQTYGKKYGTATQQEIVKAWEQERKKQKGKVLQILKSKGS